jgi:hypothetical protein
MTRMCFHVCIVRVAVFFFVIMQYANMGSSSGNSRAEMQGKAVYIRSKVVGPCTSGSYVHWAALFLCNMTT